LLTTVRQALHLMGRESRGRGLLLLVVAIGTSLLEVLAAAMIYLLLGLVADPSGTVELPVIGNIRELAGDMSEKTLLLTLIGIMIGFFIVRAAALMTAEYLLSRAVNSAAARLSQKLVRGYLRLPFAYHLQHNSAELIRNGHQATLQVAANVFNPMIRICAEAALALSMLVLLVSVSPLGAALALLVVGGTTVALLFFVQPRLRRIGNTAHAMHLETLESLQQSLNGVRDVKILGREDAFADIYGRGRKRLARTMYIQAAIANLPRVAMETAMVGFILVLFAITLAMGEGGQGALSVLGLFAYAGLRLQPSLQRIVGGLNSLKWSTALIADLYSDLRTIEEYADSGGSDAPIRFERDIHLDNVAFGYEGTDVDALGGVDMVIRRGEQIGICGPSGGGKTTLVDIISGLLAPSAGRVLVDGHDIASSTRGWQRNLGMVPQTVFLIDDTFTRNIALGIADEDIDEAALHDAVHLAQLDDFIASLDLGLETVVGERGVRISGGERQRIAIARALYNRPQVLIFDEGTSALDNMTERELMLSLKRLRGSHTILLVAHRLSTVRDSDRVVFVKDGRIGGIDTFEGLVKSNPAFREMAEIR
jgi:ABC-type multidrug transport system fused ATPase/permease subunit